MTKIAIPAGGRLTVSVEVEVPFHDVDAMQVVWHGHYAKYFELARCALLDQLDYNYHQMLESGYLWPVIDLRIRYVKSALFKQRIRVVARVVEWENRLRISYLITDADEGWKIAKGQTDMVAVATEDGEMLLASPPILYQKLGLET